MLSLMRRPFIKRLQRASLTWFKEGQKREKARQSMVKQERFARRYGLLVVTWSIRLMLLSLTLTWGFRLVLYLQETGVLLPKADGPRAF